MNIYTHEWHDYFYSSVVNLYAIKIVQGSIPRTLWIASHTTILWTALIRPTSFFIAKRRCLLKLRIKGRRIVYSLTHKKTVPISRTVTESSAISGGHPIEEQHNKSWWHDPGVQQMFLNQSSASIKILIILCWCCMAAGYKALYFPWNRIGPLSKPTSKLWIFITRPAARSDHIDWNETPNIFSHLNLLQLVRHTTCRQERRVL